MDKLCSPKNGVNNDEKKVTTADKGDNSNQNIEGNGSSSNNNNNNNNNNVRKLKFARGSISRAKSPTFKISSHPSHTSTSKNRTRLATFVQIGEDWLYLALLGIIMALLSFSMDTVITLFLSTRLWLFNDLSEDNIFVQYLGWCLTPIVLVTFSSGFVHLCSPTAIGSGIPEMKTILRGVVLNEYLTFRTLISKVVGLTFTLGSGLPLGKEGPFVHIASIVATLLSKLVASFQGIYENESRTSEMLSAACAVGVAATFYAPIGGVLFSIEVTTVYFAVRNYWRGFFAACCGATIWRLLSFWVKNDESISALFKTNFSTDYPFDPVELLVFMFIGASCGLAGAAYIKFHREIVQFFRRRKRLSAFLQQNRFVYPILITLIITTVTFPPLIGKYTASTLSTHTTIEHLFSNRTWSLGNQDLVSKSILDEWTTDHSDFYLHLVLYIAMLFWTSALASTIPIPSGLFIPVLKMGAAYGRLLGELMHVAFPDGIKYGDYVHPSSIVPGSYAVVGAAAFSGAVTHTISTSVILFEMTGQIVHIIPVILGVLIANAVCQSLQPSIYDSIIEIKKLPYLPPIASSNSISHKILVKDFMNTKLAFVWKERCTYANLKELLASHNKIISFPLVESPTSMKLLGSVARPDLLKLLYLHLGRERRLQEVCRRNSDTLAPTINNLLTSMHGQIDSDDESESSRSQQNVGSKSAVTLGPSNTSSSPESGNSTEYNFATLSVQADDLIGRSWPDSTRLITDAQQPINYGSANERRSPGSQQDAPSIDSLSSASNDEDQANTGIAITVNHYDRGSMMDEEKLDKCNQEIQDCITRADEAPEIVIAIPMEPRDEAGSESQQPGTERTRKLAVTNILVKPVRSPPEASVRPLSPLVELKALPSFSSIAPASPSLNRRPTKSILKTSSTTGSFGSTYRRNISSQSFAGSANSPSIEISKQLMLNPTVGFNDSADLNAGLQGSRDSVRPEDRANFTLGDEATPVKRRKVRLPRLRVVDMTPEEQEQWEKEQLNASIDISKCQVDEAPFQLVEQTSLYRVHTLFSMLGLNHAYVTSFGRLVGIVALKDIRYSIEKMLQE